MDFIPLKEQKSKKYCKIPGKMILKRKQNSPNPEEELSHDSCWNRHESRRYFTVTKRVTKRESREREREVGDWGGRRWEAAAVKSEPHGRQPK